MELNEAAKMYETMRGAENLSPYVFIILLLYEKLKL